MKQWIEKTPGRFHEVEVEDTKPRMTFDQLARVRKCQKKKAQGLPCDETKESIKKELQMITWSVGLTTVKDRLKTYLPKTLEYLERGGFHLPHLFIDGCSEYDVGTEFDKCETTFRFRKIGTVGNFMLGLWELYIRNPHATRYVMFQDDFVCVKNMRQYLEKVPYPNKGYCNLLAFPLNEKAAPTNMVGFFHPEKVKWRGLGAVALMFDKAAVQELLRSPHMIMKVGGVDRPKEKLDGGIVEGLRASGILEYVHVPSLVQHTGSVSTLGHMPYPKSETFPGEQHDALELLEKRVVAS